MKKLIALCIGATLLVGSSAEAQVTCRRIGNNTYCSNGLSSQTNGKTTFYSNGVTRQDIGNTSFYTSNGLVSPPLGPPAGRR
jgi:hypothetical protein